MQEFSDANRLQEHRKGWHSDATGTLIIMILFFSIHLTRQ